METCTQSKRGVGGGTEEEYGLAGHDLTSESQGRGPGGRCTLCPILTWDGQGYIHPLGLPSSAP